jgi:hypothetical protein
MTYFLGRDVSVYLTTEHKLYGITAPTPATSVSLTNANISGALGTGLGKDVLPRTSGALASSALTDVTGIDLGFGTVDEDTSFFGLNSSLSTEIKKELTVTLTKKKNSALFDALFNDARYGVYTSTDGGTTATADATGSAYLFNGLMDPKIQNFGYRLQVKLKDSTEIYTIRNACLSAHTVTLNADGTQEETAEFYAYTEPVMSTGISYSVTGLTALTEL